MSSDHQLSLHVPRYALWILGFLLLAPWLVFGGWVWLGSHQHPATAAGAARIITAPVAPPVSNGAATADLQKCRPGPWGDLEYYRTLIEPPEEFILTDYTDTGVPPWVFKGYTAASLTALLQSAGLEPAQRQWLADPAHHETTADAILIRPDPSLITALSPAARAKLYTALADFPENTAQANPYRLRIDAAPDWLEDADLPDAAVELTKRLLYQRGVTMCFSDYPIVLATLPTPAERSRYVKTLSRKSALILQMVVRRGADIAPLDRYWSRGRRSKDIAPLLQSLARRPNGGTIDIIHLLPPFARSLLNTYPLPSDRPIDAARDCHWTSFNFFNDTADERFTSIDHTRQVLFDKYYPVFGEPTLGDIVMLTRKDGTVVHSCVYIADDIVFTKNGPAFSVPWTLSPLDSVMAFYSSSQPLEIRRYRAKNQ